MSYLVNTEHVRKTNVTRVATSTESQRKSKIAIFWEKNPKGIIKVLDRRAVNK